MRTNVTNEEDFQIRGCSLQGEEVSTVNPTTINDTHQIFTTQLNVTGIRAVGLLKEAMEEITEQLAGIQPGKLRELVL